MGSRRRNWVLVAAVIVAVAFFLHRAYQLYQPSFKPPGGEFACGEPCGEERWRVKTLSDADAPRVDFSSRPTTVAWLIRQPAPGPLRDDARDSPTEFETFTVRARLLEYKEERDRDFHLVLADLDDPSQTMIAEVPSANCSGACASSHSADFEAVRSELESRFGAATDRFRRVPGEPVVRVTGVGFFDFLHQQRGVAPNGIELHPVLRITFE